MTANHTVWLLGGHTPLPYLWNEATPLASCTTGEVKQETAGILQSRGEPELEAQKLEEATCWGSCFAENHKSRLWFSGPVELTGLN